MAKVKTRTRTARGGGTADFDAALRGAGLRRTAARVAVLERLAAASGPLSHGEVAEMLGPARADRATVYRNLVDLVDVGLARRSDLGDHVWRFELSHVAATGHALQHPHFVCTDCGGVSCLPEGAVQVTGGRGRPRALSRRTLEVQLRGRCDACAP